jgi:hypothetical protein
MHAARAARMVGAAGWNGGKGVMSTVDAMSRALERWVRDGLISESQAEAILAAEHADERPRRVAPLVEAAGYLGTVLAGIAAIAIVAEFWADLRTWAQIGLPSLTAAALLLGGRWIADVDDSASGRLLSFLWFLSSAAAVTALVVATERLLDIDEPRRALLVGLGTVAYGGWLWLVRPRPLQQVVLAAGVLTTLLAALSLFERPPVELFGLAVWALGVAWALLEWGGLLRPARTAYALGGIAVLAGPQLLSFEFQGAGLALGLASAGALFATAARIRPGVLLGFGAVGVAVYVPQTLSAYFPDVIGVPALLLVSGVVVLAASLVAVKTGRRFSEVPGSAGETPGGHDVP